jgi:hypothetical protein
LLTNTFSPATPKVDAHVLRTDVKTMVVETDDELSETPLPNRGAREKEKERRTGAAGETLSLTPELDLFVGVAEMKEVIEGVGVCEGVMEGVGVKDCAEPDADAEGEEVVVPEALLEGNEGNAVPEGDDVTESEETADVLMVPLLEAEIVGLRVGDGLTLLVLVTVPLAESDLDGVTDPVAELVVVGCLTDPVGVVVTRTTVPVGVSELVGDTVGGAEALDVRVIDEDFVCETERELVTETELVRVARGLGVVVGDALGVVVAASTVAVPDADADADADVDLVALGERVLLVDAV